MASTQNAEHFNVGDWVTFRYGTWNPVAQIVEYRGALGVNGRRIYAVRVYHDVDEPDVFELPEDELEAKVPGTRDVVDYLKNHLIELLHRGSPRGTKVWLTYGLHGSLTYTFEPGRGIVGGSTVPYYALQGENVFEPKKDHVRQFLASFGLNPAEAREVLAAVGTP